MSAFRGFVRPAVDGKPPIPCYCNSLSRCLPGAAGEITECEKCYPLF